MYAPRILVCGIASLVACGSSDNTNVDGNVTQHDAHSDGAGSGSNVVTGQVNGQSFDAKDAIWNQFSHTNGFSFVGNAAFVEMTDYAGACALAAQDLAPTTSRILDLGVAVNDASAMSSVPTVAGTFTVHSSANPLPASANVAQVYFGSGCSKDIEYEGISGTVTIATVHQDGSYVGTFDVVVSCSSFSNCAGADAHLTGQFSSAACVSLNVNTIPACS
jgi:hypothetical protein